MLFPGRALLFNKRINQFDQMQAPTVSSGFLFIRRSSSLQRSVTADLSAAKCGGGLIERILKIEMLKLISHIRFAMREKSFWSLYAQHRCNQYANDKIDFNPVMNQWRSCVFTSTA